MKQDDYEITLRCVRCASLFKINKSEMRTPYYCMACR